MSLEFLDFIFPFFVFFYGLVMSVIYHSSFMMKLAEEKFSPEFYKRFRSHQLLGFVCFVVGAIWSLQNIWFYG